MRAAGKGRHARRLRGLIIVLWPVGLRIHEALALNESDLDRRRDALLVRRGKGGRRREVGTDEWAREHLQPWIDVRVELPVRPLFSVISGRRAAREHLELSEVRGPFLDRVVEGQLAALDLLKRRRRADDAPALAPLPSRSTPRSASRAPSRTARRAGASEAPRNSAAGTVGRTLGNVGPVARTLPSRARPRRQRRPSA